MMLGSTDVKLMAVKQKLCLKLKVLYTESKTKGQSL